MRTIEIPNLGVMRPKFRPQYDRTSPGGAGDCAPTVLIVDGDLGFTFWLGQALDAIGWTALPAQDTTSAQELVRKHRLQVDVLVIDPFVRSAFAFVAYLRKVQPRLQVVAAIPDAWEKSWPPIPEFDAAIRKPIHFTAGARIDWVDLIRRLQPTSCNGSRNG